ncbi:hypothetical protein EBV26_15720 [bacterium]|nr:hypothetical protein [bacterium]
MSEPVVASQPPAAVKPENTLGSYEPKPYNDNEFNQLFKEMIEENEGLYQKPEGFMNKFSSKKLIIIKPTDLTQKTVLFDLLGRIIHAASKKTPEGNVEVSNEIKKNLTSTFFLTLYDLITKTNDEKAQRNVEFVDKNLNTTILSRFITRLNEIGGSAANFFPIISTLRDYYVGKHTISFDNSKIANDALKKQIEDAQKGIDNQFSLMSAFIGTKSQKVAARTAVIAGAATGLWALVAKLQQNPQTSAILTAVVTAAGPQAAIAGGIFAVVVVGYYAFMKIQNKYAKYYKLIQTMNEYIIVLNKIDRLVRLSYFISSKYCFDVNLKEIESQLKVIFKRFDGLLNDDDRSKIEKDLETNLTPSVADAASNVVLENAGKLDNTSSQTEEQKGQGQGQGHGLKGGGFLSIMGFDEDKWNKMLNDDVIKLNIYFTASMTEFNMILNVIQMTQLTDDGKPAPAAPAATAAPATGIDKIKATTREIKSSTEYHKMVIGILLNDILKLRVDYSFCSRGGGIGGMTKTNDELVCLENTGVDPAGNKMSLFRKNLHEQMKHLVSVLNNPNTPYPPEIKSEILKEVVEPYKIMVINSQQINGSLQDVIKRFNLTPTAIILQSNGNEMAAFIQKEFPGSSTAAHAAKAKAAAEAMAAGGKHSTNITNQTGGEGFFSRFRETKPSAQRDTKIIEFLKQDRLYEFVSDQALNEFLARVNKFVKAANEPTPKEKEEALKVAEEISKMTNNSIAEAAKAKAEAGAGAGAGALSTAPNQTNNPTEKEPLLKPSEETVGGRRRFTRRRDRTNYRNTRGRKQTRRIM